MSGQAYSEGEGPGGCAAAINGCLTGLAIVIAVIIGVIVLARLTLWAVEALVA